ncbi:MAG: adenosylcobinamide-phosphate synthase CbiB [Pseudomonadota bacterium]
MLALALILDGIFGEPDRIWRRVRHPVIWIGDLIEWLERRLNRGGGRRVKGVLALLAVLTCVLPIPLVISAMPFGWVLEVLGAAILLAHRSLVDHVAAVATGLRASLAEGRTAVSMIVGRDPEMLDEHGVGRAAIESAAENFSDGVVAPAFWFLVAGLPGIAAYKAINTADSMIGYKSERFRAFGWASARLDDVVNWVPARIAGLAICVAGGGVHAWQATRRDAGLHRSPNAGWPEAAMAASLGVALAGPRTYATGPVDDPYMNPEGREEVTAADIDLAISLLWRTWVLLVGVTAAISLIAWAVT